MVKVTGVTLPYILAAVLYQRVKEGSFGPPAGCDYVEITEGPKVAFFHRGAGSWPMRLLGWLSPQPFIDGLSFIVGARAEWAHVWSIIQNFDSNFSHRDKVTVEELLELLGVMQTVDGGKKTRTTTSSVQMAVAEQMGFEITDVGDAVVVKVPADKMAEFSKLVAEGISADKLIDFNKLAEEAAAPTGSGSLSPSGNEQIPTHRCPTCGAFWKFRRKEETGFAGDTWQLIGTIPCGPCCDNTSMDNVAPVNVDDILRYLEALPDQAVAPSPEPELVQAVIPWDIIDEKWQYAATEVNGLCRVYKSKPVIFPSGWWNGDDSRNIDFLKGFVPGTVDHKNSLQERPKTAEPEAPRPGWVRDTDPDF